MAVQVPPQIIKLIQRFGPTVVYYLFNKIFDRMDDGLDNELLEAIEDEHYDRAVDIIETYDDEHDTNIAERVEELCKRLEECECDSREELESEAKTLGEYTQAD